MGTGEGRTTLFPFYEIKGGGQKVKLLLVTFLTLCGEFYYFIRCFPIFSHHCVSSCVDGTIKVWNMKSTECLNTFRIAGDVPVNSVHPIPKSNDQFLICNRTNTIAVVNLQGQVGFFWLARFMEVFYFFLWSTVPLSVQDYRGFCTFFTNV